MTITAAKPSKLLCEASHSRVVEMAWEDRTPFECGKSAWLGDGPSTLCCAVPLGCATVQPTAASKRLKILMPKQCRCWYPMLESFASYPLRMVSPTQQAPHGDLFN